MPKLIRLEDSTYKELGHYGHWEDTMDSRIIKDLVMNDGNGKVEFASRYLWDYIKANLQGEESPAKPLSYESLEFGTITQREISQTYEHVFGAKTKKVNGVRILSFDLTKLQRLSRIYDLNINIKVLKDGEAEEDSSSEKSGSVGSDWTDVGIPRYTKSSINGPQKLAERTNSERESTPDNGPVDSLDVSNVTHPNLTLFSCYHCEGFDTDSRDDYESHMAKKHFKLPAYPSIADLQRHGLKAQGKDWEK